MLKTSSFIALSVCSLAAWGQDAEAPNAVFYVDENISYDSNIFRVERETPLIPRQGDTRASTGAGVDFSAPISRQKLVGAVHLTSDRYSRFEELDHAEHDARLTWEWQGGDGVGGQLGAVSTRRLASFSSFASRVPDLLSQRRGFVEASAELSAAWRLRAEAASQALRHDTRTTDDVDSHQASAGVDYVSRTGNSIGPFVRQMSASYPNDPGTHDFHQRDAGLRLVYEPGEKTRIEGRVARARRDFSSGVFTDSTRMVYRLDGQWRPTEKLGLGMVIQRDFGPVEDVTTHHVFIHGVSLRLGYGLTEKTTLSASLDADHRAYPDEPQGRHDNLAALRLSLSWRPAKWITLGLSLQRETRSSDLAMTGYGANGLSLSARLSL